MTPHLMRLVATARTLVVLVPCLPTCSFDSSESGRSTIDRSIAPAQEHQARTRPASRPAGLNLDFLQKEAEKVHVLSVVDGPSQHKETASSWPQPGENVASYVCPGGVKFTPLFDPCAIAPDPVVHPDPPKQCLPIGRTALELDSIVDLTPWFADWEDYFGAPTFPVPGGGGIAAMAGVGSADLLLAGAGERALLKSDESSSNPLVLRITKSGTILWSRLLTPENGGAGHSVLQLLVHGNGDVSVAHGGAGTTRINEDGLILWSSQLEHPTAQDKWWGTESAAVDGGGDGIVILEKGYPPIPPFPSCLYSAQALSHISEKGHPTTFGYLQYSWSYIAGYPQILPISNCGYLLGDAYFSAGKYDPALHVVFDFVRLDRKAAPVARWVWTSGALTYSADRVWTGLAGSTAFLAANWYEKGVPNSDTVVLLRIDPMTGVELSYTRVRPPESKAGSDLVSATGLRNGRVVLSVNGYEDDATHFLVVDESGCPIADYRVVLPVSFKLWAGAGTLTQLNDGSFAATELKTPGGGGPYLVYFFRLPAAE